MTATREVTVAELATIKNALRASIGVSCKKCGKLVGLEAGIAQPHLENCSIGRAIAILDSHLNPPKDLKPHLIASLDRATGVVKVSVE